MEFFVSVLKIKAPSPGLKQELRDNDCRHLRPDLWIFEGNWERALEPWLNEIEHVCDGIVGPMGGRTSKQIREELGL